MGGLLSGAQEVRTTGQRVVLAQIAGMEALRGGERDRATAWALRAWGDGALLEQTAADDATTSAVTAPLSEGDRFAECRAVIDALLAAARRSGSAPVFATGCYLSGCLNLFQGRLADAVAELEQSLDPRLGWELFPPAAAGMLAGAFIATGALDRARAALAIAEPLRARFAHTPIWGRYEDACGLVALADGDPARALTHFQAATAILEAVGARDSPMLLWRTGTAYALAQLGRLDEAAELADEQLAAMRRWGAPTRIAGTLRVRAAVGRGLGIDDLREAEDLVAGGEALLERARTRSMLGASLRAAGEEHEAREILRRALDDATAAGAVPLAGAARAELIAAGGRPRRARLSGVAALTPSELRVARMAAEGRSNREIAEALFVTRKAVEFHLGNAFRKLSVRTRGQLPAALAG
jgi:DNA-binding CsgD family transcriptional regulator